MKSRKINQKLEDLSSKLDYNEPISRTKIDPECFSEREKTLLIKTQEILEKYAPVLPPYEVFVENKELFDKAAQIIVARAVDLYSYVLPRYFGGGEIEKWFFWNFFFNFCRDYAECLKTVAKWSYEDRDRFVSYLKKSGKEGTIFNLRDVSPDFFANWALCLSLDDDKK